MSSTLSGLIQESLVAILLYDKENGRRVRNTIPLEAYDGPYRRFAKKAFFYWDEFGEPPGEQTLDLLAEIEQDEPRQSEVSKRLYDSIQECLEGLNADYALNKAAEFIRSQSLRSGILEAVDFLEKDDLEGAEQSIRKSIKTRTDVFHPGVIFAEFGLSGMVGEEVEVFPTGIGPMDQQLLGPVRGELHLLIAPSNYGKSWYLLQLAKMSVMSGRRVVFLTLEMSERKVAGRFLQSFCAMTKRPEPKVVYRMFEENELGQFVGIELVKRNRVDALSDISRRPRVRKKLLRVQAGLRRRSPLIIRQFPPKYLTTTSLVGYLECLEAQQGIAPDLLCIDYPDLMAIDGRQEHRIALGTLFQELRGLAVDRNIALAVVSQTNRQALGKKLITEKEVAEDYSKIATSDTAISYNQTDQERSLGLARLYIMKARNEEKGRTILLSQSYATGQFCISATRMLSSYWKHLQQQSEGVPGRRRLRR